MVVLCLLYLISLWITLPLQILLNGKTLGNGNCFSFDLNLQEGSCLVLLIDAREIGAFSNYSSKYKHSSGTATNLIS